MRENITALYPDTPAFYKLTLKDGKYYVGSTKRLARRLRRHRLELETKQHHNPNLSEAFTSWEDISVDYTEYQYVDFAKQHEQGVINERYGDPLLCNVGTDVDKLWGGIHGMPQEVRNRIGNAHRLNPNYHVAVEASRLARLGKAMSEEQKRKISESMKGIVFTEEHRANLSRACKGRNIGRKATPEAIENMRKAQIGRVMSEDAKRKIAEANFKKVSVDDIEYRSLQDCAVAFGVTITTVTNRVKSDKPRWSGWKLL